MRRPDTPPRVISSGRPLRISVQGPAAGPPDIQYSVTIRADGRPELSTLRVSGSDGATYRDQIRDWLASTRFAPATLDGVPVAAEFRVPR